MVGRFCLGDVMGGKRARGNMPASPSGGCRRDDNITSEESIRRFHSGVHATADRRDMPIGADARLSFQCCATCLELNVFGKQKMTAVGFVGAATFGGGPEALKRGALAAWLCLMGWCCFGDAGLGGARNAEARDFVLTIGGGYSPSGNQASLERNVLFFRRVVADSGLKPERSDTFFSDGDSDKKDLQVIDVETVPKPNRLMAEFFGSRTDLGLSYRNHQIPAVRSSCNPEAVREWFAEVGKEIVDGDRLLIYVTAHGQRSRDRDRPYNTSIAMWNNSSMLMRDFARQLDQLPDQIEVVMVMVQCYTGGFSHVMYRGGDPKNGLSPQRRVGFYATVHDRPAAGCTPEADEASYAEYSTYFLGCACRRGPHGRQNRSARL